MGDYADDAFEADFNRWIDEGGRLFGGSDYFIELFVLKIVRETEKAWLLKIEIPSKENKDDWFPKSQCKLEGSILLVPVWLSVAKGYGMGL